MMEMIAKILLICIFFLAPPCIAAENALRNIKSAPESAGPAGDDPGFAPGKVIVFSDGSREVIETHLSSGGWRTREGSVISPLGVVMEGRHKDDVVEISADAPETGKAEAGKPEEMDIADLLPSTPYPDGKGQAGGKPRTLVAENGGKGSRTGKGEDAASGKGKEKETGKGAGSGKVEDKGGGKGAASARPGDPLRIPEDAVNTGSLSFLEGCWQGTRPEYFSKRTVKECFCFNANGRSGKRRVYDITQGNRMCVGATRANLSRRGVLSVTSSGAVCNDGERWGGARMICRNSGPRTPCSWVFTDANNGTQAYEIPFIRVQSCGR